jgi:hypothetical protein
VSWVNRGCWARIWRRFFYFFKCSHQKKFHFLPTVSRFFKNLPDLIFLDQTNSLKNVEISR